MKSVILFSHLVLLVHYAVGLMNLSSMYLLNPIELEAGLSLISAKITDTHPGPCSVSLHFDNSNFLPITYTFQPLACAGAGLVNFVVPLGAPSGEAYITVQCAGESKSYSRAFIAGGQSDVHLVVPPLTVVCETAPLDRSMTQTSTTMSFPLATPEAHSDTSLTTVVTKYITDYLLGSTSTATLTITMADEVIPNHGSATHIHDAPFATNPIIPNIPGTRTLTETSTPTPRKTTAIGTIGPIGTLGPRATPINSNLHLAVVTSSANTTANSLLLALSLFAITYWLF